MEKLRLIASFMLIDLERKEIMQLCVTATILGRKSVFTALRESDFEDYPAFPTKQREQYKS